MAAAASDKQAAPDVNIAQYITASRMIGNLAGKVVPETETLAALASSGCDMSVLLRCGFELRSSLLQIDQDKVDVAMTKGQRYDLFETTDFRLQERQSKEIREIINRKVPMAAQVLKAFEPDRINASKDQISTAAHNLLIIGDLGGPNWYHSSISCSDVLYDTPAYQPQRLVSLQLTIEGRSFLSEPWHVGGASPGLGALLLI